MKKRQGLFSVCAAAGVLAAVLVLSGCALLGSMAQESTREPALSIDSVEITGINFTGLDLLCRVKVENPNGFDIPFPEVGWEFFVNANSFVKGIIENGEPIKSRGSTIVNVPVTVTYAGLYETFQTLKNSDDADYRIAAGLKFQLPVLGERVLHLEHSGKLPMLKTPSLAFKGISIKGISLTKIDFQLDWEVENNNNFAMTLKDLSYNFKVNNAEWTVGRVPNAPVLPPKAKTLVPVVISLNGGSVATTILGIITRGSDVTYDCGGNISISGDLPGLPLPDFNLPFNYSGTTRLK
jgi:LEA14-like dessication related protein